MNHRNKNSKYIDQKWPKTQSIKWAKMAIFGSTNGQNYLRNTNNKYTDQEYPNMPKDTHTHTHTHKHSQTNI